MTIRRVPVYTIAKLLAYLDDALWYEERAATTPLRTRGGAVALHRGEAEVPGEGLPVSGPRDGVRRERRAEVMGCTLDRDAFENLREFNPSICTDCYGNSPTVAQMNRQLAENGDVSGACSRCNNTHVDPDWIRR